MSEGVFKGLRYCLLLLLIIIYNIFSIIEIMVRLKFFLQRPLTSSYFNIVPTVASPQVFSVTIFFTV